MKKHIARTFTVNILLPDDATVFTVYDRLRPIAVQGILEVFDYDRNTTGELPEGVMAEEDEG